MKVTTTTCSILALTLAVSLVTSAEIPARHREPDPAPAINVETFAAVAAGPGRTVVGTKDAPVDGQDGMPHSGPYVSDRQKQDVVGVVDSPSDGKAGNNAKLRPSPGSLAEEAWKMGPENDGVMLDRGKGPKDGPRGTEGGVSEKSKDRKAKEEESGAPVEKQPDPPKEPPPPPAHDKVPPKATDKTKPKGAVGLEKPADLPEKPHDIPHPEPPTLSTGGGLPSFQNHLGLGAAFDALPSPSADSPAFRSFMLSLTMIIFSEIGDKTFLVAALMAMRHPRKVVFSAAFSALITMTLLSALLGHAVPVLLSQRLTTALASLLFFVFGVKLLREGLEMDPNEGVGAEMKEVEQELNEKEQVGHRSGSNGKATMSNYALEAGTARHRDSSKGGGLKASKTDRLTGLTNLCSLLLSPAWVQTFVMTFLGEWGDRSQIATVAMAAGDDWWWVTGGGIVGHGLCTGAAVIGGRAIAGKVSMRVVTLGGAAAFFVFAIIYLYDVLWS